MPKEGSMEKPDLKIAIRHDLKHSRHTIADVKAFINGLEKEYGENHTLSIELDIEL
ncbi:hypothetical protein [uncultured Selenomonas sp.]|uniref:hypothetical protein n=1 Tax=uncultured Selenomonas sp. TaxID=159275 RepID=UPI00262E0F1D|nr:hypothetical protein [uncultured Selenomonas sp.]